MLNYIGPNSEQGIKVYIDGSEVARDTEWSAKSGSGVDGQIVVGRMHPDVDDDLYISMLIDELIFFNQALAPSDAMTLYNDAD